MAGTKNSISSLLAQFLRLQQNSLEIINQLSNATTTTQDTVNVQFLADDNTTSTVTIPSWGYILNEIKRLDNNIKSLSGLDDGNANVRNADGTVSRIYQSTPLIDPASPGNLQVPANFKFRTNGLFQNFLNPLLFVTFNLDGEVPPGTKRVFVKRIVANTTTDAQKNYFDTNLKGRNDISDADFMSALATQSIGYYIDENPADLPLQVVRYKGGFSVLRVFDQSIPVTVNGQIVSQNVRKYKLDAISYKDTISNSSSSDRQLKTGDVLMSPKGSKFEITAIDLSEYTVVLKRIGGYEPVSIGVDALTLSSEVLSPLQLNVNIGHDERQAVFIKAINDDYHVTGSSYSNGVVFHSNEMVINTPDGTATLNEFYKKQVADFGTLFLSSSKEKVIPSVYGLTPNTPTLSSSNFQVLQINKQITQTATSEKFASTVQSKVTLQNEIDAINKSIDDTRKQIADLVTTSVTSTASASSRQSLLTKIDSLSKEKSTKTSLLQSVIQDLNNISSSAPEITQSPIYRVRGFWPIPSPVVDDKMGSQEVIQFRVRYRYLTKQGNATQTDQIKYTDNDGTQRAGTYSNWVEYKTDIRKKGYNTTTKKYYWLDEDVTNGEIPNINQIDIAISSGEKLEIKVASVSEAGWPLNSLESDFSSPVVIDFPAELSTNNNNDQYVQQNSNDQVLVALQKDLTARGLDDHLGSSFNSGDKYYAHVADTISSGFFDSTGKALDVYQKLLSMDQEIAALKALIAVAKGVLSLYIKSPDGSSIPVSRGSVIELFAGYYNEIFTINPSLEETLGKISSTVYSIELRNDTASPLELASVIPGGLNTMALISSTATSEDYKNNRKYDSTPLSLTGVKTTDVTPGLQGRSSFIHAAPYQSGNSNSQFVYTRYKSVGFDEDLYFTSLSSTGFSPSAGTTSGNVPLDKGALVPYDPTSTTLGVTRAEVWNGAYSSGSPVGNGKLNEFCIHTNHPAIKSGSVAFSSLLKPAQGTTGFNYPAFRHSAGFQASSSDVFDSAIINQTKSYQQLAYTQISSVNYGTDNNSYPEKLGFSSDDEYLIGKYSCGAYLFLAPSSYGSVQVEGSTALATKKLSSGTENAIVIPLIFQMRCMDKLGNVGGYRSSGTIRNITYNKKIGIDIKINNEEIFSFDVSISGSYSKTALASPTYSSYKNTLGTRRFQTS